MKISVDRSDPAETATSKATQPGGVGVETIDAPTGVPDNHLTERILQTLTNRYRLGLLEISVKTNEHGAVLLEGSVPALSARIEAEAICWAVPGVTAVTSHLEIQDCESTVHSAPSQGHSAAIGTPSKHPIGEPIRTQTRIVVGVDGSAAAEAAAMWAAREAHRRRESLLLVHAYMLPPGIPGPGADLPGDFYDSVVRDSENQLTRTAVMLRAAYPVLGVAQSSCLSTPYDAITGACRAHDQIVVGSQGISRTRFSVLGSVAQKLITRCRNPVTVIPANAGPAGMTAPDAPVLVGLDGSAASEAALTFALQEAQTRNVKLVAVRVWSDKARDEWLWEYPVETDPTTIDAQQLDRLNEQVEHSNTMNPPVTVRSVIRRGRASTELLNECAKVQPCLLVLGSRGRGGFAGLWLGSTTHEAVTHSRWPVTVIHAEQTEKHETAGRTAVSPSI